MSSGAAEAYIWRLSILVDSERNRIKIRVEAAIGAQAKDEGRFLGGRPPYGYLIADAGPHPNPAKAAGGKRLHKPDIDPEAMPVVVSAWCRMRNHDRGLQAGTRWP